MILHSRISDLRRALYVYTINLHKKNLPEVVKSNQLQELLRAAKSLGDLS